MVNPTISCALSIIVTRVTAFDRTIWPNFSLHVDERTLLYFSKCSRKVLLGEIILNTLLIDDFLQTVKAEKKTGLSNSTI